MMSFLKKLLKMKPKKTKQRVAYETALEHFGLREIVGEEDNPVIVKFFEDVGHGWVKDDETAWCAAFMGSMLKKAGLPHTGKLTARSYLQWGEPVELEDVKEGDVVIFSRGDPKGWQGHVCFFVGFNHEGDIRVLGGNQQNAVTIHPYRKERLLGIRRMNDEVE